MRSINRLDVGSYDWVSCNDSTLFLKMCMVKLQIDAFGIGFVGILSQNKTKNKTKKEREEKKKENVANG